MTLTYLFFETYLHSCWKKIFFKQPVAYYTISSFFFFFFFSFFFFFFLFFFVFFFWKFSVMPFPWCCLQFLQSISLSRSPLAACCANFTWNSSGNWWAWDTNFSTRSLVIMTEYAHSRSASQQGFVNYHHHHHRFYYYYYYYYYYLTMTHSLFLSLRML